MRSHGSCRLVRGGPRMNQQFRLLTFFLTLAIFLAFTIEGKVLPRHKQNHRAEKVSGVKHHRAAVRKRGHVRHVANRKPVRSPDVTPQSEVAAPLSGDVAAIKDAFGVVRKGKVTEATAIVKRMGDRPAEKLVEWRIM